MAVELDARHSSTVVIQPDTRFATSFLSTKYRDHAVPGEALMDKTSGELFMKRPIDGKVISFSQNKKVLDELVLNLRVLLTNNAQFTYNANSTDGFCVSTNYDSTTINNEVLLNLMTDNIVTDDTELLNKLTFKVSADSNGFFCRPATRDVDKPVVEFLSNQYNTMFLHYEGDNETYLEEANKFIMNERWLYCSTIITYVLTVTHGDRVRTYEVTDYLNMNETCAITFPTIIWNEFQNGIDSYEVNIKSINPYKVHFMVEHASEFGEVFSSAYQKLLFADNRIGSAEINIIHFIDKADDVDILGNETIIAFLDIPKINNYMSKMAKLMTGTQFITKVDRPEDYDWMANGVWAERVRDLGGGGIANKTGSPTNIEMLERMLSIEGEGIVVGRLMPIDDTYTDEQHEYIIADVYTADFSVSDLDDMINIIDGGTAEDTDDD